MLFSMLFPIFTFKGPDLADNLTNMADTSKIVGLCRIHGACFFQLQGTLDTWWNQGNTKCQGECWSGLLRESRGPRPCWTTGVPSFVWAEIENHTLYPLEVFYSQYLLYCIVYFSVLYTITLDFREYLSTVINLPNINFISKSLVLTHKYSYCSTSVSTAPHFLYIPYCCLLIT